MTQTEQTSTVAESTHIALDNWTSLTSANDRSTKSNDVDPHEDVVRVIQVIGNPPIVLFGTVANLLTFITMQRGSLKNMSTCFYMAILGLAETGALQFFLLDRHILPCQK